jgi:hypothetical protein
MEFILLLKTENNQTGGLSGWIEANVGKIRVESDEGSLLCPTDRKDIRIGRTLESLLANRLGLLACLSQ